MIMDIFIIGHGAVCLTKPFCQVPKKCTVHFYCYPSSLLPYATVDRIIETGTPEPIQSIAPFQHYPTSFIKNLNDPALLQQRQIKFEQINRDHAVLFCLDMLGDSNLIEMSLEEIINMYKDSSQCTYVSHFNFHWVSCRQNISFKATGGVAFGINSGFHMHDPRPDFTGRFVINPTNLALRRYFDN